MRLEYFGHSFWRIITEQTSIVIDPFDNIGYQMPANLTADFIVISHEHHDHNNTGIIKGDPQIIRTSGEHVFSGIKITLLPVFHDDVNGAKRGINHIICLETEGRKIVHCGDLGHIPEREVVAKLINPDTLLIPVGEIYTLSLNDVIELINLLNPGLIFPMHYQTPVLGFKLGNLDRFLKLCEAEIINAAHSYEIGSDLMSGRKIVVMDWQS